MKYYEAVKNEHTGAAVINIDEFHKRNIKYLKGHRIHMI